MFPQQNNTTGTKIVNDKMISTPNQIGLGMTGLQMLVFVMLGCGQRLGFVAKPLGTSASPSASVGPSSSHMKHAYAELKVTSD